MTFVACSVGKRNVDGGSIFYDMAVCDHISAFIYDASRTGTAARDYRLKKPVVSHCLGGDVYYSFVAFFVDRNVLQLVLCVIRAVVCNIDGWRFCLKIKSIRFSHRG